MVLERFRRFFRREEPKPRTKETALVAKETQSEAERNPLNRLKIDVKEIPLSSEVLREEYVRKIRGVLSEEHLNRIVGTEYEKYLHENLRDHGIHELKITVPREAWEKLEGIAVHLSGDKDPLLTISAIPHENTIITAVLPKGAKDVGSRKRYLGKVAAVFGRHLILPYTVVRENNKSPELTIMDERDAQKTVSRIHGMVEVLPMGDKHIIVIRHVGNKNHPIIVTIAGKDGKTQRLVLGKNRENIY